MVSNINNNGELTKFFYQIINEASRATGISIESFEQDWLAQLLSRFCSRKEFLDAMKKTSGKEQDEKDQMQYKYLVEMAMKAMQEGDNAQRALRNLRIGDQALFTAGFFPERIKKQLGSDGVDYYEKMSRTGYHNAASILEEDTISRIASKVTELRKIIRCICIGSRENDRTPFAKLMMECGQAELVTVS